MTREEVLNELIEKIGKPLTVKSDRSYWSFEDHHRAAQFVPLRNAARRCFVYIRDGGDPLKALKELKKTINTGIECNVINLLINKLSK
jgi:hypothetical protein